MTNHLEPSGFVRVLTTDGPRWAHERGDTALLMDDAPWRNATPPDDAPRIDLNDAIRLAPATASSKIVCFGKTYAGHVREMGWERPAAPVMFLKPASALCAPDEPVVLPPESTIVEPEAELAVVIGAPLRRASIADAAAAVFGYTIANDVSARDLMVSDGQWARAKGFDTFLPLGPRIVTTLPDASEVEIVTRVNGEICQRGSTAELLWPVADLVARASVAFTLNPGDLVLTGSPSGRRPLRAGDEIEISMAGVGVLRNGARTEAELAPALSV